MATITVRGHGTSTAQPDEVGVGLTVEAIRPRAAEAFAEASRLAMEAAALCDGLGIPAGRLTTSRISLGEHGEHTSSGWQHRGYRASSRIGVRLDDAELASRLVSEAAERLETTLDGPTWRVARDNPAHAEARRLAAADARSKADEYAAALGVRVGAVASVVESGIAPPTPEPRGVVAHYDIAAMPLHGGEHDVVAEIDVTFRLEHG